MTSWVSITLLSAVILGAYELLAKRALLRNDVVLVLAAGAASSATVWLAVLIAASALGSGWPAPLAVAELSWAQHGLVAIKSLILVAAGLCTTHAYKHLPISVASPIRATVPLWTLFGGVVFLGETLTALQALGVIITVAGFIVLSISGKSRGARFEEVRWIAWTIVAAMLGACSSVYDRYLLGWAGLPPTALQCWFTLYLAAGLAPFAAWAWFRRRAAEPFVWRWSVLGFAMALFISDLLYFHVLTHPDAKVALVACLRRSNILVAFVGGVLLFGEEHWRAKLPAVAGILAGLVLVILG